MTYLRHWNERTKGWSMVSEVEWRDKLRHGFAQMFNGTPYLRTERIIIERRPGHEVIKSVVTSTLTPVRLPDPEPCDSCDGLVYICPACEDGLMHIDDPEGESLQCEDCKYQCPCPDDWGEPSGRALWLAGE